MVPERFPCWVDPVMFLKKREGGRGRGKGVRRRERNGDDETKVDEQNERTHSESILAVRSIPDEGVLIDVSVSTELGNIAARRRGAREEEVQRERTPMKRMGSRRTREGWGWTRRPWDRRRLQIQQQRSW